MCKTSLTEGFPIHSSQPRAPFQENTYMPVRSSSNIPQSYLFTAFVPSCQHYPCASLSKWQPLLYSSMAFCFGKKPSRNKAMLIVRPHFSNTPTVRDDSAASFLICWHRHYVAIAQLAALMGFSHCVSAGRKLKNLV